MAKLMNLPQITQLVSIRARIQTLGIQNPGRAYDLNSHSTLSGHGAGLGERTQPCRNPYLSFRVLLVTLSSLFLDFR